MILVDASAWIAHLRRTDARLVTTNAGARLHTRDRELARASMASD